MVERHKMIAAFEQLDYSSEMLRNAWDNQSQDFKGLISGGWTNNYVLELINYIRTSEYADRLFPGTSLGTLLISKPRNGKLNYQQTLAISVNNEKTKIKLTYSDWDVIDRREESQKAILWKAECNGEKLKETFCEFMEWNKNWH
jgi:hypothetical protein